MAEAFLGLKISVLLHSGIKLEGVVSQLEPSNQQMTLKDVTLYFFGQPPHHTPVYGVVGKDIKDLQVLSTSNNTKTLSSQADNNHITTTRPLDNHVLEQVPPPKPKILTPSKSISKTRKIKQSQLPPQQQYRNNNNHSGWAGEDVNIFKEEEFDFQKNLDMFDKKKVFAEIRESDETAPEELLVTLNRLPQKEKKIVNLLPSENVLDNLNERTAYYNDQEDDFGDESDNDSQTPNEFSAIRNNKRRSSKGGGRRKGSLIKQQQLKSTATVKIVTAKSGIICPTVLPLQMAHVEHECKKISPSFEELSIENSARGTALLILQQQLYTATTITVVILVGANNKNGAVGLATARHLINHGCLVTCCVTSAEEEDDEENDLTMKYQLQAEKFGVSILSATTNLPTKPDFIIDAILGSEDEKLIDIQQQQPLIFNSICNMINWTNTKKKTPIISIDFPTGIDSFSGIPMHPEYIIRPKWTICLGAPKSGCKSKNVTGDLFLLDIGISRLSWKKIGIKGNTIPWGADFLVALDYDI